MPIFDPDPLIKVGINLFYGYGYNFYREENQLRADDQKVRALVCDFLSRARKGVTTAEAVFRREQIPVPTRANPFPPPEIVADARRLELLGQAISGAEGQVRHAPVPENDLMTRRFRDERNTLVALAEKDALLVGLAETLCAKVEGKKPAEILNVIPDVEDCLAAIASTLAERRIMTI